MLYGYTGKILQVNLSDGALWTEEPSEEFYRTYIGGSLLGLYYLFKYTSAGLDPLAPDNVLVFALSGLTGAPISGQSRATVVAKSPLTGAAGDSQAGGFWPAELKFAGYDAIVIRGRAQTPVFLWIKNGECELRDASHLWGKTTREAEDLLIEELQDEAIEIAQIGPAGEGGVRFAAIMNMSNRAHGRTGMGAVMGSKNLKAVVVRGTDRKIPLASPKVLQDLAKSLPQIISKDIDMQDLSKYGTPSIVEIQNRVGGLVTNNWSSGYLGEEKAKALSGERLYDELLRGAAEGDQNRLGRDTCYACTIRCKRVVESEWQNRKIDPESGGPEYETIATFGSYCGIDDLHAVAYANQLSNDYGVDTISAGATMAFAIECFENGLITIEDTDGIALRWGNADAVIAMLEKTLKREGFGDVLAEGSSRASSQIGSGAEAYAITSKQQELPAHMPHVKRSLALIYATNPFGADHQSSEHDIFYEPSVYKSEKYRVRLTDIGLSNPQPSDVLNKEKVNFVLTTQYAVSAIDTFDVCHFVFGPTWQLMGMAELARVITAVIGWDMSINDLLTIGARRLNMLRAFNAREGINREADTLPERFFREPLRDGPTDGILINKAEFEKALDIYYKQAGWDPENGNPTHQTLKKFDLEWVARWLEDMAEEAE